MQKRRLLIVVGMLAVLGAVLLLGVPAAKAQGVYAITYEDIKKAKATLDDPSALYEKLSMEKVIPPEVYKTITFDEAAMQALWAEVVGFKAPDVVGKIAPDIKPGKYTLADKEKFKDLMIPGDYARFAKGEKPYAGNFSELTVVPTRQYYWALPIGEATKKNAGTVKLDDKGYLQYGTYQAGFPFPQTSGTFQAQQIMYNWEKRYMCGESFYLMTNATGINADLGVDFESLMEMFVAKLEGRVIMEPLGYFDERAKANQEQRATINCCFSPRDLYGNCFASLSYSDPNKQDQPMMYLNVFRRVRKMSGTDTQDPMGGQDYIYEDGDGFNQKLSPNRYPYTYEIVEDKEMLVPAYTLSGGNYLSTKDHEVHAVEWERRPVVKLKLTQQDPNFIYSYRLMWFDKETLMLLHVENYDQKGRLYRDFVQQWVFAPKLGLFSPNVILARDYIDSHTTYQVFYTVPAKVQRADLSIQKMIKGR